MLHALLFSIALTIGPYPGTDIALNVRGSSFSNVACNAPFAIDPIATDGFRFLDLKLCISRSAATDVRMICKYGDDSALIKYKIVAEQYAGATASSGQKIWKFPDQGVNLSGSDCWGWTLDVWSYRWVQCIVSCTSGNINDRVSASATLGVQR